MPFCASPGVRQRERIASPGGREGHHRQRPAVRPREPRLAVDVEREAEALLVHRAVVPAAQQHQGVQLRRAAVPPNAQRGGRRSDGPRSRGSGSAGPVTPEPGATRGKWCGSCGRRRGCCRRHHGASSPCRRRRQGGGTFPRKRGCRPPPPVRPVRHSATFPRETPSFRGVRVDVHHHLVTVAGSSRVELRGQGTLGNQPEGIGAAAGRRLRLDVPRLRILRFLIELLGRRINCPADNGAHLRRQQASDDEHAVGIRVDAETVIPPPLGVFLPLVLAVAQPPRRGPIRSRSAAVAWRARCNSRSSVAGVATRVMARTFE